MIVLYLFLTFFKIGLFTIGGGYAMIPMIQDILSHGWVSQSDLIDFIAISESTPGPFAINIATFVGMSKAGLIGAVSATLGVASSFLIILIIAKFCSFPGSGSQICQSGSVWAASRSRRSDCRRCSFHLHIRRSGRYQPARAALFPRYAVHQLARRADCIDRLSYQPLA